MTTKFLFEKSLVVRDHENYKVLLIIGTNQTKIGKAIINRKNDFNYNESQKIVQASNCCASFNNIFNKNN